MLPVKCFLRSTGTGTVYLFNVSVADLNDFCIDSDPRKKITDSVVIYFGANHSKLLTNILCKQYRYYNRIFVAVLVLILIKILNLSCCNIKIQCLSVSESVFFYLDSGSAGKNGSDYFVY
jgi:hypothetical protein